MAFVAVSDVAFAMLALGAAPLVAAVVLGAALLVVALGAPTEAEFTEFALLLAVPVPFTLAMPPALLLAEAPPKPPLLIPPPPWLEEFA